MNRPRISIALGWWVLMVAGLLVAIVGGVYGIFSHSVIYRIVNKDVIAHLLVGDSSSPDHADSLQMEHDNNLYVFNTSTFSPTIGGKSFGDGSSVSFIYRTDSTTYIDIRSKNTSTHLTGNAYTIEQITVLDSNGQKQTTFSSAEYTQHPNGFYQNNWPIGGVLLALGLVIFALGLIIPLLRGRKTPPAALEDAPSIPLSTQPSPILPQPPYSNPGQYPPQSQQSYPGLLQPSPIPQQLYANPGQYPQSLQPTYQNSALAPQQPQQPYPNFEPNTPQPSPVPLQDPTQLQQNPVQRPKSQFQPRLGQFSPKPFPASSQYEPTQQGNPYDNSSQG